MGGGWAHVCTQIEVMEAKEKLDARNTFVH